MRPVFSICHPTARPAEWRAAYDLWISRATYPDQVEYVLCVDERWGFLAGQSGELALMDERPGLNRVTWNSGRKCMVDAANAACAASHGAVLIIGADDFEPLPGWDVALLEAIAKAPAHYSSDALSRGLLMDFAVHVLTGWYDGPMASSVQIFSRARYERLGYAFHPTYESLYADDDFLEHAYADGAVIDARHITIRHNHGAARGETDAVYQHQNREESRRIGALLLQHRRRANFGRPGPVPVVTDTLKHGIPPARPEKVILFCPVRESADTLRLALEAHRGLRGVSQRWYFDDCDEPAASNLLDGEKCIDGAEFPRDAGPAYQGHNWHSGLVSRVAAIKDEALRLMLETDADAVFLVDADVILHPDTVRHLLGLNLPVVSEVFWSQWPKYPDVYLPQVWDVHPYSFHSPESVLQLREPGCYKVGGLGACTLIRREALEMFGDSDRWFAPFPGLGEWGEDRHFCTRASAAGISLHADTALPAFHVYRAEQLDEARGWFAAGCPADYFRSVWLAGDWSQKVRRALDGRPRRIACCFPGEAFHRTVSLHWSALMSHLYQKGFWPVPIYGEMSNPHDVRELIRQMVMDLPEPVELALWIDDDNLLLPEQFDRLITALDALPAGSIVAGWAWCDGQPPVLSCGMLEVTAGNVASTRPLEFEKFIQSGGLVPVDYTGFPAVLMSAATLADAGPLPFAPLPAPLSTWGHTGEDVTFCLLARERCGSQVFVDPGVFLPHLKVKALGINGAPVSIEQASGEAGALARGSVEFRYRGEPVRS